MSDHNIAILHGVAPPPGHPLEELPVEEADLLHGLAYPPEKQPDQESRTESVDSSSIRTGGLGLEEQTEQDIGIKVLHSSTVPHASAETDAAPAQPDWEYEDQTSSSFLAYRINHQYCRPNCNHSVMDRQYTLDDWEQCSSCGRLPYLGWFYECSEDVSGYTDSVDINGPLLSPWILKAIDEGKYTKEQIDILYRQKLEVLWTARVQQANEAAAAAARGLQGSARQHGETDMTTTHEEWVEDVDQPASSTFPVKEQPADPPPPQGSAGQQDETDVTATHEEWVEDVGQPASSTSPVEEQPAVHPANEQPNPFVPGLVEQLNVCRFRACHHCQQSFHERTWINLGTFVYEKDFPPFDEDDFLEGRISDARVVRNLGLKYPQSNTPSPDSSPNTKFFGGSVPLPASEFRGFDTEKGKTFSKTYAEMEANMKKASIATDNSKNVASLYLEDQKNCTKMLAGKETFKATSRQRHKRAKESITRTVVTKASTNPISEKDQASTGALAKTEIAAKAKSHVIDIKSSSSFPSSGQLDTICESEEDSTETCESEGDATETKTNMPTLQEIFEQAKGKKPRLEVFRGEPDYCDNVYSEDPYYHDDPTSIPDFRPVFLMDQLNIALRLMNLKDGEPSSSTGIREHDYDIKYRAPSQNLRIDNRGALESFW